MGATDVNQDKQQEEQQKHDVFDVASIEGLGKTVQRRWVRVPEWDNKEVCMWGTTRADIKTIYEQQKTAGEHDADIQTHRIAATVMCCARDGDGDDAERLFNEFKLGWLQQQPTSVLDRLYNAVQELDLSSGVREQDILDFFGMMGALNSCLRRIASVCDACTDCPESSRMSCPLQLFGWLSSRKKSSENESTDTSVTTAEETSEADNGA